ncbi:MAG: DUF3899 domain-containing protein [Clostridia bacterium]|nr:DUF3899 domain-containing protein [Clostridia bacterium]
MKKKLLGYGITTAIALALILAYSLIKNLFNQTNITEIYKILSDGFFIAAVMILAVVAMSWLASKGTFYSLSYAVKMLFSLHNWSKTKYRDRQSYADYVAERQSKVGYFPFYVSWVGFICLALAVVFMLLFNKYYVG